MRYFLVRIHILLVVTVRLTISYLHLAQRSIKPNTNADNEACKPSIKGKSGREIRLGIFLKLARFLGLAEVQRKMSTR